MSESKMDTEKQFNKECFTRTPTPPDPLMALLEILSQLLPNQTYPSTSNTSCPNRKVSQTHRISRSRAFRTLVFKVLARSLPHPPTFQTPSLSCDSPHPRTCGGIGGGLRSGVGVEAPETEKASLGEAMEAAMWEVEVVAAFDLGVWAKLALTLKNAFPEQQLGLDCYTGWSVTNSSITVQITPVRSWCIPRLLQARCFSRELPR